MKHDIVFFFFLDALFTHIIWTCVIRTDDASISMYVGM